MDRTAALLDFLLGDDALLRVLLLLLLPELTGVAQLKGVT